MHNAVFRFVAYSLFLHLIVTKTINTVLTVVTNRVSTVLNCCDYDINMVLTAVSNRVSTVLTAVMTKIINKIITVE